MLVKMQLTRRQVRDFGALGLMAFLAACGDVTTTKSGNTTTVTLDTQTLNTQGTALLTLLQAADNTPLIVQALGANKAAVDAGIASAKTFLANIASATNGSTTVAIDNSSVASTVTSFLTSVQGVISLLQQAAPSLVGSAATDAQNIIQAALAAVSFVQLAVTIIGAPTPVASAAAPPRMSKAQVLAVAAAVKPRIKN